jgi:hypothetical protein
VTVIICNTDAGSDKDVITDTDVFAYGYLDIETEKRIVSDMKFRVGTDVSAREERAFSAYFNIVANNYFTRTGDERYFAKQNEILADTLTAVSQQILIIEL